MRCKPRPPSASLNTLSPLQVNQSFSNMALVDEEARSKAQGRSAHARSLQDLPDDLLRHIVMHCAGLKGAPHVHLGSAGGHVALVALGLTCRRLRAIAVDEPRCWEALCRQRWGVREGLPGEVPVVDPQQLALAGGASGESWAGGGQARAGSQRASASGALLGVSRSGRALLPSLASRAPQGLRVSVTGSPPSPMASPGAGRPAPQPPGPELPNPSADDPRRPSAPGPASPPPSSAGAAGRAASGELLPLVPLRAFLPSCAAPGPCAGAAEAAQWRAVYRDRLVGGTRPAVSVPQPF